MADIYQHLTAMSAQSWANVIALIAFALAFWSYNIQQRKDRRVERQENYLRVELESNEIFRFEAEHGGVLAEYKAIEQPSSYAPDAHNDSIADQFFLQQLNLFEIVTRTRQRSGVEKEIFGSWVVWFESTVQSWWFRKRWPVEFADNYTADLYAIFTPAIAEYEAMLKATTASDPSEREAAHRRFHEDFFEHVAAQLNCRVILRWLDRPETMQMARLTRGRG